MTPMSNLLRIQFATIKEYANGLTELEPYESKKELEMIKNQIEICEKVMEEM